MASSWQRKEAEVRQTRHAGHCWRSRDKLISDILLWTPSDGRAKAGRPARTYMQQLCVNTVCSLEDLPEVMVDRNGWQERVREICAGGATWWWWYIYIYICVCVFVFTNPSAGCDRKSIFKQSTGYLNSNFTILSLKSLVCPTIYP